METTICLEFQWLKLASNLASPSIAISSCSDSHLSPTGKGLKRMNASITGTQANGLGMVIVGGYKEGEEFGIFVKSIRPNGAVAQDG